MQDQLNQLFQIVTYLDFKLIVKLDTNLVKFSALITTKKLNFAICDANDYQR